MSDQDHASPCACDPRFEDCTLVMPGGAVKALGEGKVGGMVVRFGLVDPQGDVFDRSTQFWVEDGQRVPIIFHHGLGGIGKARTTRGTPLAFGRRLLGWGSIRHRDDGLEVEDGKIDLSIPGATEFYEDISLGKVGWSSGSSERLVEPARKAGEVRTLAQWPINEISLTYTPVERRNRAVALKALLGEDEASHDLAAIDPLASEGPFVEFLSRLATGLERAAGTSEKHAGIRRAEGRPISDKERLAIKSLIDTLPGHLDRLRTVHQAATKPDRALLDRIERLVGPSKVQPGSRK